MRFSDYCHFITIMLLMVPQVFSEFRRKLPCVFSDSINITEGTLSDTDGSILHNNLIYESHDYALINYIEDSYGEIHVKNPYFRGCICQVTNCVWLCCNEFEDINGIPTCIDINITELLVDVVDAPGSSFELDLIKNGSLYILPRLIVADMALYEKGEWSINSTGYIKAEPDYTSQESYCLIKSYSVYQKLPENFLHEYEGTVYNEIAILISLPCMLVTLLIYLCIPELRNTHGKCLICYIFSMTCCFSMLLYKPLIVYGGFEKWSSCYHFLYFWTMAGFFWLNVICFDIFWTFSNGVVKKNERKRFLYYSLYAWGIPLLFVGLLTAIDRTSFVPEEYRPNITSDCGLGGDKYITFIYMYSVMLVLVLVNIFFFILTVTRIIGVQRAIDAVLQQGSKRNSSIENRYRIHLYLRLFVVMGVSWIFEVISPFVCPDISCQYPTDMLNSLLGVLIFLLFVCKTNVKDLILKRIRKRQPRNRSKSSRTISTSTNIAKEATVSLRQLSRTESCSDNMSDD